MVCCAVPYCRSNNSSVQNAVRKRKFFRVPKAPSVRLNWEIICCTKFIDSSRVCSDHFPDLPGNASRLPPKMLPKLTQDQGPVQNGKKSTPFYLKWKLCKRTIGRLRAEHSSRLDAKKGRHDRIVKGLKKIIQAKDAKITKLERKISTMIEKSEAQQKVLQKVFTGTQLDMLNSNKSKTWWPHEDIIKALRLRTKSKSAYLFVRDQWGIPLPGISTLHSWVQSIKISPGILHDILNLLKLKFVESPAFSRQCCVTFDEVNIDGSFCYDQSLDQIFGGANNLLVVFVRGILSSWKIPVYMGFDIKLQRVDIDNIMMKLGECSLVPGAMTCDNSGANRGIWTRLNVSFENTSFQHPTTGNPIYCISDPVHLIKLLRNNILDWGITLADKHTQINKGLFEDILKHDRGELKICHNLTQRHLDVQNSERQNARLAFQTLSNSVASAIEFLYPQKKSESEFIRLVSNAFDILNSRCREESDPMKQCYGVQLEVQKKILDEFYQAVFLMRVNHPRFKSLLPFQKGILMTINSVKSVYNGLVGSLGVKYLATNRLNQDIAENGFSIMRGMGRFKTNMTAVDAKYRLRTLALIWLFLMESDDDELAQIMEALQEMDSRDRDEDEIHDSYETFEPPLTSTRRKRSLADQCEHGGLEYVGGYLLRKLKHDHPDLVLQDEDRLPESWCQKLSRGGLTIPSDKMMSLLELWEAYFEKFHGLAVNKEPNVMRRLAAIISLDFPNVDPIVVMRYVRVRTFLRIKYLNKKMLAMKSRFRNSRKANQFLLSGDHI